MTYKVSSNENPYPPLESVQKVVAESAATINRYPDMAVTALTARIAEAVGVEPQNVATGTGSVGLLSHVVQAMCDAGDEVVYAWRSFEAYPIVVAVAGAASVQVPLDEGGRHRLDAMADAITDRTKVVVVCTPNNPTGPSVTAAELDAFLARVPRTVLVVLDEAYLEFVTDDAAPDAVAVWRAHPNVMVLRTFSKAYGLAGLRVGYAVRPPAGRGGAAADRDAVRGQLDRAGGGHRLARRVRRAAGAGDGAGRRARADRRRAGRAGLAAAASQANFVWFPLGADSAAFAAACDEAGLVVRRYGDDGVRVTVAEPEANDRLLEVARAFGAR